MNIFIGRLETLSHFETVLRQYFHCLGLGVEGYCLDIGLGLEHHCLRVGLGLTCLVLVSRDQDSSRNLTIDVTHYS